MTRPLPLIAHSPLLPSRVPTLRLHRRPPELPRITLPSLPVAFTSCQTTDNARCNFKTPSRLPFSSLGLLTVEGSMEPPDPPDPPDSPSKCLSESHRPQPIQVRVPYTANGPDLPVHPPTMTISTMNLDLVQSCPICNLLLHTMIPTIAVPHGYQTTRLPASYGRYGNRGYSNLVSDGFGRSRERSLWFIYLSCATFIQQKMALQPVAEETPCIVAEETPCIPARRLKESLMRVPYSGNGPHTRVWAAVSSWTYNT